MIYQPARLMDIALHENIRRDRVARRSDKPTYISPNLTTNFKEVFSFAIWDHVTERDLPNSRLSTKQFIESVPGASIRGAGRFVDQRLVNVHGQLLINPKCASAKLLKRLNENGTHALERDEFMLGEELSNSWLAELVSIEDSKFAHKITELGRIFLHEIF